MEGQINWKMKLLIFIFDFSTQFDKLILNYGEVALFFWKFKLFARCGIEIDLSMHKCTSYIIKQISEANIMDHLSY